MNIAEKYGNIKAVLWHQGESDANPVGIPVYELKLASLIDTFRTIIGNGSLPILMGELGSFSSNTGNYKLINEKINAYSKTDPDTAIISTNDLRDKGDKVHFNSAGQRLMGQRMAEAFIKKFN